MRTQEHRQTASTGNSHGRLYRRQHHSAASPSKRFMFVPDFNAAMIFASCTILPDLAMVSCFSCNA
jgi:hypothetical protein